MTGTKQGGTDTTARFDTAGDFDGSEAHYLSGYARGLEGSTILAIAAQIREKIAAGEDVLDLTVGDFRPGEFPIPAALADLVVQALREGETNYPPVEGVKELRQAIRRRVERDFGLEYPLTSVLVAGGARPLIYATFMAVTDPGDSVLYPVPSWNNHHYAYLAGARKVEIEVHAEKNFHLDRSDLEPHLDRLRLIAMNSPLNPTGTCISREALTGICEAIVEENRRRHRAGARPLFLMYDQVYHALRFGDAKHNTPVGLVPEVAPYTILIDAVSKALCATGLRVGWAVGPPPLVKKMAAMAGHYGSWAPRPEQVATGRYLADDPAVAAHRSHMVKELGRRLGPLHEGLAAMQKDGLPVSHIAPQGAIYLSARFDLIGRRVRGRPVRTNDDLRSLLLSEASFAIVPFEAFGFAGEDGWVRISVGAVSAEGVRAGLGRLRRLLEEVE